jgi:hypothetical protein
MNLGSSGDYNIVVTARSRGTLPTASWSCSYFLFVGDESLPKGVSKA